MTTGDGNGRDQRVLLLAATPKDIAMTRQILEGVGIACASCATAESLCAEMHSGAGAVLLTEHAFDVPDLGLFVDALRQQPPWSDLPVVALVQGGAGSPLGRRAMDAFGNVTVLERPVQMASLASVLRTLIRSRRRQYQNRQYLMEREDAAESLRRSETMVRDVAERLRLIFHTITDYAIFTTDARGYITEWTEGAERVKGWKPEEIIGRHISIVYPPELVASGELQREIDEATANGRAEREAWRLRKNGERFWANEIATAMRDSNGNLLGFTRISRDLSERKRMQEALQATEERHRLMVENVREYAIFMTDPDGRIMTWNTGAERIFGYTEAEIRQQDSGMLFTPEDRAAGADRQELATAAAEGRASDDRWQMRRGGERFFASGVTTSLRDKDGTLRGFVKVCRDLTERRQIEQQRERLLEQEKVARLEAERAMTIRDEFLAVVSHELRTPLTAILLWAKMLGSGSVDAGEQPEVFDIIRRSAEAQQQLIEDLLDISRMMSGKLRLNLRDVELAEVVEAAVETVRPMAQARGVHVELKVEERTGPVRGDPDRIQQVAWNLLNNAVKFTGEGGRVDVSLRRLDGKLQLQVVDTGQGIGPEFVPHLFERFRQADATSTRRHGGLGLGLAISRELVELHGGTIRAYSAGKDQGTTFTVELPAASTALATGLRGRMGAPTDEHDGFQPSPLLKDVRVLVVEDEADTRTALRWLLERCAANVTVAASAAQAVAAFREALRQRPFDVVISDIGMPVQNGYELLGELREMEQKLGLRQPTPAIALTAYARSEDQARATAAGFQAHVPKPVEPAALVRVVSDALSRTPCDPSTGGMASSAGDNAAARS